MTAIGLPSGVKIVRNTNQTAKMLEYPTDAFTYTQVDSYAKTAATNALIRPKIGDFYKIRCT